MMEHLPDGQDHQLGPFNLEAFGLQKQHSRGTDHHRSLEGYVFADSEPNTALLGTTRTGIEAASSFFGDISGFMTKGIITKQNQDTSGAVQ